MSIDKYDFLIIGAGILGLTAAKQLTESFPQAKIAVIEKERQIGLHASGRNSGVMHSGIYYPKNSLKASVCRDGAQKMLLFAKEHNISHNVTGKIIIATQLKELASLDYLLKNAEIHQIKATRVNEQEIKEIEPYASPFQYGIYVPDTANIDSKGVLDALVRIITSRGVKLYLDHKVIDVNQNETKLITNKTVFNFGYVFNCAGSGTDKIAHLFGLAKEYRLLPFKGFYYKLKKERSYLVNSNIYPVPDLDLPFLGVHFTKSINHDVYVGPTAIPALGRENYGLWQGMSLETIRILKDIGLMYLANHQHFRELIHSEIKKIYRPHFIKEAQRLMATLTSSDLVAGNKVGIRPQLINIKKRSIEMDYIIEQGKNSIHVLNAISPAFTSAFSFSKLLVDRL